MQIKESLVSNVLLSLSEYGFDKENLIKIQNVLYSTLDEYNIEPKKELPAYTNKDVEIIKHFLLKKKISGCSDKTIKTYYTHIRMFFDYAHVSISSVDSITIYNYIAAKMKARDSTCYCNDTREILYLFFEFCKIEGYVKENPCDRIERIKYVRNMEDTFTDMDIVIIRNACKTKRETALIDLLISTGARRDEVRKIKISDVDFHDRSILIRGKGGKARKVYFSARCEYSLMEYINSPKRSDEYLFCSSKKPYRQLSEDGIGLIIRNIGRRTNVENVHTHRFRGYFATYMINKGVPIQDLKEMMGHSKLDTTSSYYVRANLERVKYQHKNNAD